MKAHFSALTSSAPASSTPRLSALRRPGRATAAVGGVVAIGAAGLMAVLAGTASAATPGTCVDNVNVRAEPTTDARIVAVCDRGTAVEVGEKKNGFVKLENLGGWAVEQYVRTTGGTGRAGGAGSDSLTSPRGDTAATPAPTTTTRPAQRVPGTEEPAGRAAALHGTGHGAPTPTPTGPAATAAPTEPAVTDTGTDAGTDGGSGTDARSAVPAPVGGLADLLGR